METKLKTSVCVFLLVALAPFTLLAENPKDVNEWRGKTIMYFSPHPDDEMAGAGTLAKLAENGNTIYIVLYTTGNKGSRDLEMTSERLAQIRKKEDENAMKELGVPAENMIWLGYDDGMLEYVPEKELCEKVCRLIRKYRPDAVFSFDPGAQWMQWHKTDHRMAAFVTLDGARAAAYHLYFPHHRIYEDLQPFTVTDFLFYGSREPNFKVDITDVSEKKIRARSWHVSQFGPGNFKYVGPEPNQKKLKEDLKNNADKIAGGEKIYEEFRRLSESMSF